MIPIFMNLGHGFSSAVITLHAKRRTPIVRENRIAPVASEDRVAPVASDDRVAGVKSE